MFDSSSSFWIAVTIACASACSTSTGGSQSRPGTAIGSAELSLRLFEQLEDDRRFVEVGDNRVQFVELGLEGDGSPPWVLVHGLGGSMGDFGPFMLSAADSRRVLTFDLPGFGGSVSHKQEYTIHAFVRVLRDFLNAAGEESVHLICHSMGGQICLAFSLDHARRVESLTLIDAAGTYERKNFIRHASARFAGVNVGKVSVEGNPVVAAMTEGDRRILQRVVGDDAFLMAALDSFRASYRLRVQDLRVPTLIVWGTDDPLFPVENAFFLKENIAGSTLHLVDGGGHSPQIYHPELVLNWVRQFHERLAGARSLEPTAAKCPAPPDRESPTQTRGGDAGAEPPETTTEVP